MIEKKLRKYLVGIKKVPNFAAQMRRERALSSAGSERLPYKQRVGGSNPSAPTTQPHAPSVSALERALLRTKGDACLLRDI